jgi:hypothetical protein
MIGTHLLYLPSYLNVRVLPAEIKQNVTKIVENFCKLHQNNVEFVTNPYGQQRWQGLIQYMMAEDWTNKLPMLRDYLTVTDQQRGTNFIKTFPELKRII